VLLIVTFPKLNVLGLDDNCAWLGATPVPLSAIDRVCPDEELPENVIVPVTAPTAVGVKTAV
jgi:hypothetical protein